MKSFHKFVPGMFALMILLGGLGLGVVATQEFQTTRGRAAETKTPQTNTPPPSDVVSYASQRYNYTLSYDKNIWTEANGISQGKQDLKSLLFKLNPQFGMAEVAIESHDEKALSFALASPTSQTGDDNLEKVALFVQSKKPTLSSKIIKTERITKNGADLYKLTIEQEFLKKKIYFDNYIFLKEKNYYEISIKSLPGKSSNLADTFLNSFILSNFKNGVKGASDTSKEPTPLNETKIAELSSPSVVNILNINCPKLMPKLLPVQNATVSATPIQYFKRSYEFCTGAKGSGFFITRDGHIATNGHVAKSYPMSSFISSIHSLQLNDFLVDLYRYSYLVSYNEEVSRKDAQVVMSPKNLNIFTALYVSEAVTNLLDEKSLLVEEGNSKYFIKLGNEPFPIDAEKASKGDIIGATEKIKETDGIKEATLVDYNFPNNDSIDVLMKRKLPASGSDVAILKITNSKNLSFPGLKLEDVKNVKEGNSLVVIGYPGLVEGAASASSFLNFKSSSKPTITRGIISAIKEDQDGRKLLQTDVSLEHGNSGGPGFDTYGNVVGIATYAQQSLSGQYNFLRSTDEIKDLMKKNHVALADSSTYVDWHKGLEYFWNGYYRKSLKHFEKVKEQYSIHPSVDSYISNARIAIKDGKDKEGLWGSITEVVPASVISGILALFVLIGVGGIAYMIKRKKHLASPAPSPTPQATIPGTNIPMPQS